MHNVLRGFNAALCCTAQAFLFLIQNAIHLVLLRNWFKKNLTGVFHVIKYFSAISSPSPGSLFSPPAATSEQLAVVRLLAVPSPSPHFGELSCVIPDDLRWINPQGYSWIDFQFVSSQERSEFWCSTT